MGIDVNAIEQTVVVTAVGDEVNVNVIDQPVLVSVTDQIIEVEASGGTGPQGPAGAGVAAGGTTGQVLSKASSTNYDTVWVDAGAGTVYSVNASGSTGISVTGGPITGAGTLTITNTAPDQVVSLSGTGGTVITGTYPNFTIYSDEASGYVPYTGALQNVDLGEYELKAGQLTLDVSPTGTAAVGTTRWNNTIGSSETTLKGGNVVLKNGVDLVARVVNKVSPNTTLTKAEYQAVRISGAQGQRLAIELAQGNNDNNSADTIGLVTETIAPNQEGFIITVGQLENINTTGSLQGETWTDGDVLYLSPTTAGKITNVKPVAPQHLVIIGYVEYAHANNGKIYVKTTNGFELGELHDVNTSGATNGQVLKYNGTIWTPSSDVGITSLNGLNPTSQTFATGTSGTDFAISSASSTHTFNLPTASATNRGALSSSDWTTFNNKQNAITNPVTGTGTNNYLALWNSTSGITTSGVQQLSALGYTFNTNTDFGSSFNFSNNATNAMTYTVELLNYASPKATKHTYTNGIVIGQIGSNFVSRIFANGNHIIGSGTDDNGFKLEVDGTAKVGSTFTIGSIANATTDTDKFLVSDGGIVKYRTGAEVLSDIGGQAAGSYVLTTRQLTINGTAYDLSADRSWSVGTVTSVDLSVPTGFTIANNPITTSGTLAIAFASGYSLPTISSQTNWDAAYNDKINSASVTGTTTKTLTLNQQDGGTITASWTDINTDAVTSVFGRTGAVVATSGDYTTTLVTEGTNLYYTEGRVSANTDVAANTAARHNAVTLGTANGLSLSTQQLSLALSSGSTTGALSSTDWTTFNTKQSTITLTTTGSSGASTFISNTLNIPTYTLSGLGGVPTTRTLTINGTAYDLSANRTWNVGTVTTAAATTAGQVAFFNGATVITSVSGLYFDGVDKLGIATTSPAYNLDVTGTARMTGNLTAASIIKSGGTSSQYLMADGSTSTLTNPVTDTGTTNYLPKWTSGSALGNSLAQDTGSSINVGTATTYPATKLVVGGSSANGGIVSEDTASTGSFVRILGDTSNGNLINYKNGTSLRFASSAADFTSFAEQMRLTSTGLGIGTTSPSHKLDVVGTGRFAQNQNGFTSVIAQNNDLNSGAGQAFRFYYDGSTPIGGLFHQYNTGTSAYDLDVKVWSGFSATTRLFVNGSNGNTGIGTTSPSYLLDVAGTSRSDLHIFRSNQSAPTADAFIFRPADNSIALGTANSERMRINASGNVGIGTTSPLGQLDVYTGTFNRFYTSYPDAYTSRWNLGVNGFIQQDANIQELRIAQSYTGSFSAMTFYMGASERMRLNASGNLGLGVVPSAWGSGTFGFDIGSGSAIWNPGSTGITRILSNAYNNGTNYIYKATRAASMYQLGDSSHIWYIADSGTAGNAISFTQAMTLDASGNLQLGTTTGTSRATIAVANAVSTARTALVLTDENQASLSFVLHTELARINTGGSDDLAFGTNNTERLRITSGGNLALGGTTANAKMEITQVGGLAFRAYYGSGNNRTLDINVDGLNGDAQLTFNTTYNGGWKYYLSNYAAKIASGDGLIFSVASSGTAGNTISWINALSIKSDGKINFSSLPTSATGLSAGDIWNDGGTLKIV